MQMFTRDGVLVDPSKIFVNDKNLPYTRVRRTCGRCGGSGRYSLGTCFGCNGRTTVPVNGRCYTAKQIERIQVVAKRLADKRAAQAEARQVVANEREIAKQTRAALFAETYPQVVAFLSGYADQSGFLAEMHANLGRWGGLTERQLAAVLKIINDRKAKAEAALKSFHIGKVKERLTLVVRVENVYSDTRPVFNAPWLNETYHIVTMRTLEGACIVSKGKFWTETGKTITIKGTVKEHGVYRGEVQTELNRVVIIREEPSVEMAA